MDKVFNPIIDSKGQISASIVEKWVEKLLVASERDDLREAFINLVSDIYQPSQIQLFTNRQYSLIAHRTSSLAEVSVFDSLMTEQAPVLLSTLPMVYQAVEEKIVLSESNAQTKTQTLYIPLISADIVNAVFVVKGATFCPETQLLWPLLYKSYHYLNNTLYLAEIDPLTGLMNRVTFEKLLNKSITTEGLSHVDGFGAFFVLIDIDFFKKINDTFGHLYGDEVLVLLARYMKQAFRTTDWLFRYGGEEFAVVLLDETREGARVALDRFRALIEKTAFPQMEAGQVTVSIGYSEITPFDIVSSLIDRTDQALYFAKNNGRNQVADYEELVERGLVKGIEQHADIELF